MRLYLALLGCLLCTSAFGKADQVWNLEADVDGDGKADRITVKATDEYGAYVLTVGGASVTGRIDESVDEVKIIDIDRNDRHREVSVFSHGPSDDPQHHIYWYDGRKIYTVGKLAGVDFTGHGWVYEHWWAGFWTGTDKHVLDRKTHRLKKLPQEFYHVGVKAKVRSSFPIYCTRSAKTALANPRAGSTVEVVLCAQVKRTGKLGPEDEHYDRWYLVKSESGLSGWTKEELLYKHLEGLPLAD